MPTATTLTRHGITWTFSTAVTYGTYANGDYWVQGPVTVTAISPTPVATVAANGSMLDPMGENETQSFANMPWWGGSNLYDASENVGLLLPLLITPAAGSYKSLVSAKTVVNLAEQGTCVDYAAVLTVVDAPPAATCFRPWYSGGYLKQPDPDGYLLSNVDWGRLVTVFAASTATNIASMTQRAQFCHVECIEQSSSQAVRPLATGPSYGPDIAEDLGNMLMAVNSNTPAPARQELALHMIQWGIDMHGAVRNRWWGNNGHGVGKKAIILFAGQMLNDTAANGMLHCNDAAAAAQPAPGVGEVDRRDHRWVFAEDSQTFYVEETDPGPPQVINGGIGNYTAADIGIPEWANNHYDNTFGASDNVAWFDGSYNSSYRLCCSMRRWYGQLLAMHAMGLTTAWAWPALFGYLDRYIAFLRAQVPAPQPNSWWWNTAQYPEYERLRMVPLPGTDSIGIAEPSHPFMLAIEPPVEGQPWKVRINAGRQGIYPGLLMRCEEAAINPSRDFLGFGVEGLTFVDETTFTVQDSIVTAATGELDYIVPDVGEAAGTTFYLQAVFLMPPLSPPGPDRYYTTNAIKVTLL